jgi:hypothetical protein
MHMTFIQDMVEKELSWAAAKSGHSYRPTATSMVAMVESRRKPGTMVDFVAIFDV